MTNGTTSPVASAAIKTGRAVNGPWIVARRVVAGLHVTMFALYVGAILVGTPRPGLGPGNIIQGPDSTGYVYAATHRFLDAGVARAAPLFPTLVRIANANIRVTVVLQSLLACAAWHWLARSGAAFVRSEGIKLALFASVLCLSLVPEVMIWNVAIGSEGLSIATMIAAFASAASALYHGTARRWLVAAMMVVLSIAARDTNAVLAGSAVVLGIAVIVRSLRTRRASGDGETVRTHLRAATIVIVLCATSVALSTKYASLANPPRWLQPLQENVVNRIVPNDAFTRWFETRGLPQAAQLRKYSGENYFLGYTHIQDDPEFLSFRTWLRKDGQATYLQFVATHPAWALHAFVTDRDFVWLPETAIYTGIANARPGRAYGFIGALVFWRSSEVLIAWSVGVCVLLAWRRRWNDTDGWLRLGLFGALATGVLHAFIAYTGDHLEVGRHAITANVQVRVSLWICTWLLIDRARTRRKRFRHRRHQRH